MCAAEKKLISQCAYQYIRDDDTIITDSSSTVMELIQLIAQGDRKNLIIVTTSPMSVNILSECKDCNVIMIGGEFNYTHGTVEGYIANQMIKDIRADKCFIGINGIDESFGYLHPAPRGRGAQEPDDQIGAQLLHPGGLYEVRAHVFRAGRRGRGLPDHRLAARRRILPVA